MAPLKSSVDRASSSKLTSSLSTFMIREWIFRILALASSLGWGSSIFRSNQPDLSRAGSKTSTLFVAAMTLISVSWEKPSSWLRSSSMVLWISLSPDFSELNLLVPTASSSSMKMIVGAFSQARAKASLTILAPSPMYIWTKEVPESFKNVAFVWAAQALAKSVLPVPGGPNIRHPLGGLIPSLVNQSL